MVNLYLLLPVSEKKYAWECTNKDFQDKYKIISFIRELSETIKIIDIENYLGHYDSINVSEFLKDFIILEDYYPNPAFRKLRLILRNWLDWRDDIIQHENNTYLLFKQQIENHTFCECFQAKHNNYEKKVAILNHYGHKLDNCVKIESNNKERSIPSKKTNHELFKWFAIERMPPRKFHISPKHGENREKITLRKNQLISPLKCSEAEAQSLLNKAIGITKKELFNIDKNNDAFIVFKHEGDAPQNQYHGYHLPYNTNEIPLDIKRKLEEQ